MMRHIYMPILFQFANIHARTKLSKPTRTALVIETFTGQAEFPKVVQCAPETILERALPESELAQATADSEGHTSKQDAG